mgnify:CR=1 FL=1
MSRYAIVDTIHRMIWISRIMFQTYGNETGKWLARMAEHGIGVYKGKPLNAKEIPDSYIAWLALRKSYVSPVNRFETTVRVA